MDIDDVVARLDKILAALNDVSSNLDKQNKIALLEIFLDQNKYLARKVRAGEAYVNIAFFFLTVPAGATVAFSTTNPDGYVAMSHEFMLDMSQAGVFAIEYYIDGRLTPWLNTTAAVPMRLELAIMVPYDNIVMESDRTSITNNDAAQQWIALASIDTLIRKDVWEKDQQDLDQAAKEFALLRGENNG
ncbi:hypothetical protein LCGC14_1297140 [marine sediment metagenome]|uniref:Uncharacterized protein n=1 Tax=marine sediment metagenome TaxID=412755 RepID=A0A0F9LBD1_9ZZZZ